MTRFRIKTPCANCPFRNDGKAIELAEGRLQNIIDGLLEDDWSTFHCHKTTHSLRGGNFDEDGIYHESGAEAMCAGSMAYLHKAGRPTVEMRYALAMDDLSVEELAEIAELVIEVDETLG